MFKRLWERRYYFIRLSDYRRRAIEMFVAVIIIYYDSVFCLFFLHPIIDTSASRVKYTRNVTLVHLFANIITYFLLHRFAGVRQRVYRTCVPSTWSCLWLLNGFKYVTQTIRVFYNVYILFSFFFHLVIL